MSSMPLLLVPFSLAYLLLAGTTLGPLDSVHGARRAEELSAASHVGHDARPPWACDVGRARALGTPADAPAGQHSPPQSASETGSNTLPATTRQVGLGPQPDCLRSTRYVNRRRRPIMTTVTRPKAAKAKLEGSGTVARAADSSPMIGVSRPEGFNWDSGPMIGGSRFDSVQRGPASTCSVGGRPECLKWGPSQYCSARRVLCGVKVVVSGKMGGLRLNR